MLQPEVTGSRTSTQALGQKKSIQPLAGQCGTNIGTELTKHKCKPGVLNWMTAIISMLGKLFTSTGSYLIPGQTSCYLLISRKTLLLKAYELDSMWDT